MVKVDKWRFLAVGLCLTAFSSAALADSLDAQRQRYLQIKQAWDSNQMDVVAQLMPTLRDYPLYPYLEYRELTQDLSQAGFSEVNDFIKQHPTLPPAKSLAPRFVNELARREDWRTLLAFSPQAPKPIAARCNYYYAKWATGDQQAAWSGVDDIWMSGKSLPGACDKLFSVWQGAGKQTPSAILERMKLALKEGNSGLVNSLYRQLPSDYQTMGDALVRLQNDPTTVESFARSVGPTDFTRAATGIAFERLARQDAENARAMIPTLVRLQKMSDSERLGLEEAVAWRLMGSDATFEQTQWRDKVILRSQSPALLERRVRMALGAGDRQGVATWLARLPTESRNKDEWRYWRASMLLDEGKRSEGEEILRRLMTERGFYPMVAAQKLNTPYPVMVAVAAKPRASLVDGPEIARVRELMYWNMDNLARSEWTSFVASRSRPEQEALARYAFEQKWADLSVQATIVGKMWDHLEERFPVAWPQEFRAATDDKGITPSYAMAIARQESAWNPKAQSPVGASGLMQVMPRTAQHTVQMYNIPGYSSPSQLLDPRVNIIIGTSYLEYVYQQFGRNRILSSAAYNAGPSRVNTWLGNSEGRVDAVAFVESIPFSETRSYVKNVLAYDAFYRYLMHRPAKVLTDAEWQRRY
ncbi:Soluble lytic murein transglycosylase precursor [Serratia quinivorans]|jgi:soluble lytic murein transglycosylase|uniref:murein transglycosylase n=1 Tax=Serratia TaxID=613 RepID=UPI002179270A|nr:murein transglycosylase [Serratia quinivorans]CAI1109662.1 Soluble lytic murein transglycosylase precursor [Serratia quinivorans]CAI1115371.1 Soluble lytic murein transglycosylase precursor [Serratia quinivorans]CAI1148038.1 Soluble lytic murein transglycosylase precursor [Serratia quinivorans]CAI1175555.1 Soluble lytic murein transglycosylase precursor [Serratia quinivorans]CAI1980408.1 Soluble lytic murein transglycosylase precursor [Serratia quinivorans]